LSAKYSLSLQELIDYLKSAGVLKSEFSKLRNLGLNRLVFGMNEWKNIDKKPSFDYKAKTEPYPYPDKNLYINASNNLWYRTMWYYYPELGEIYYKELLSAIKRFEGGVYFFNKGIVYGNLGVSQASRMKLDEGIANILKALIEDSPYSPTLAQSRFLKSPLFTQFEDELVKKNLEELVSEVNLARIPSAKQFVNDFLTALTADQRLFFDYSFIRVIQNREIWLEKENSFTASRLLAYTQGLCLFAEDYLKAKIGSTFLTNWMTTRNKNHVTLTDLLGIKFNPRIAWGCSAKDMAQLDSKLKNFLKMRAQPNKCLKTLTVIRNFTSHNIQSGTSKDVFYSKFDKIIVEIIRAICEIRLLP
jgi:hypothetical protein